VGGKAARANREHCSEWGGNPVKKMLWEEGHGRDDECLKLCNGQNHGFQRGNWCEIGRPEKKNQENPNSDRHTVAFNSVRGITKKRKKRYKTL